MHVNVIKIVLMLAIINVGTAAITDYLYRITNYFGSNYDDTHEVLEGFDQKVPYEVSVVDEKFIAEAAKLTGVALSELDSCQHRVILKLKTNCQKLNDEEVAKLAVMLLNCQSSVEGRRIYPCTSHMSIKDCTTSMDADTWNTYHLMSNRARAVCYSVRQSQFIGITENTINRLMDTTRNQVNVLDKLATDQENLQSISRNTLDAVSNGYDKLSYQQDDLRRAQLFGQLSLEENINRLNDEKKLISESHKELASMTKSVQLKLEYAAQQLEEQSKESNSNHEELLNDINVIQQKAQDIFQKIEASGDLLLKLSEEAEKQYNITLKQLTEVNNTVHTLVSLIGGTREALEDRLSWITSALGGTDLALDRLYLVVWHVGFIIILMIISAFLGAQKITRFLVAIMPPLNLVIGLHDSNKSLSPLELTVTIGICIIVQTIIYGIMTVYKRDAVEAIRDVNVETSQNTAPTSTKSNTQPGDSFVFASPINTTDELSEYESSRTNYFHRRDVDSISEYCSPTPPLSRNGYHNARSRSGTPLNYISLSKGSCKAKTRVGAPCKLTTLPGRDFCHRHQAGDSVIG